ncbi:MAG: hypothetical protein ACPGNT_11790, partial [Rhodospirillales bacterium]
EAAGERLLALDLAKLLDSPLGDDPAVIEELSLLTGSTWAAGSAFLMATGKRRRRHRKTMPPSCATNWATSAAISWSNPAV